MKRTFVILVAALLLSTVVLTSTVSARDPLQPTNNWGRTWKSIRDRAFGFIGERYPVFVPVLQRLALYMGALESEIWGPSVGGIQL